MVLRPSTWLLACFAIVFSFCDLPRASSEANDGVSSWLRLASNDLQARVQAWKSAQNIRAKNIILFIGDGMGVATVSAARALKANLRGKLVGEETLTFENFPFSAYSKTYSADRTVTDSAASATAYWCGLKVNQNTIGVDDRVKFGDCKSHQNHNNLKCMGHYAKEAKKSVGIITTVSVTHASPAPGYAHSASRNWETDWDLPLSATESAYKDIALQFVEIGEHVDILMGAGRSYFEHRKDTRNLTREWLETRSRDKSKKAAYVQTSKELATAVRDGATDILGLFSNDSSLLWSAQPRNETTEPTLSEMVAASLPVLQKNPNGFMLFVEGGKIDWGHHDNQAALALHDTIAMDEAVKTAREMTSMEDTLIVVTADHSHVFAFGGYPRRNKSILSVNQGRAKDGKAYTYLLYGNGPGYALNANGTRRDVRGDDTGNIWYRQQSAVPLESETHGGEDVPIYASGPMSYLFTGVLEQHSIPHLMMHAACIGPKQDFRCPLERSESVHSIGNVNLIALGLISSFTFARFIALQKI